MPHIARIQRKLFTKQKERVEKNEKQNGGKFETKKNSKKHFGEIFSNFKFRLTEKIGAVFAHHLETQFVFAGLEAQGGDARRPAVLFRRI